MSSGLTPVFHQEMLNYKLKPSYEYQESMWKKYKADKDKKLMSVKSFARAVWFASILYTKRYRQRKSAYILYGTVTGTSKMYASTLAKCLDQLFQTTLQPLNEESLTLMQNTGMQYHP